MIYLIGGPPRCGKGIIAEQLASELDTTSQTVDMLEAVVQAYFSDSQFLEMFPKTSMLQASNGSNDDMYAQYTTEQILSAYKKQAETMWRAVEVLVEHASKRGVTTVIDGHHIHPQLVENLMQKFPNAQIKPVFVVKANREAILEGAKQNDAPYDWLRDRTQHEKTYPKVTSLISQYAHWFKKEAEEREYKVFSLDEDFSHQVQLVVKWLVEKAVQEEKGT